MKLWNNIMYNILKKHQSDKSCDIKTDIKNKNNNYLQKYNNAFEMTEKRICFKPHRNFFLFIFNGTVVDTSLKVERLASLNINMSV